MMLTACGEAADPTGAELGSEAVQAPPTAALCGRAEPPAAIDPRNGSWQLVMPHQELNEPDKRFATFPLFDGCDSFVSLGHSVIGSGKAASDGPSQVLTSEHGESWTVHVLDTDEGVSFRDLTQGDKTWVAVGRGDHSPGVIAVADSLTGEWRQVFQNEQVNFNSVAYGANTFVAAAQNGVAVSHDGENWSWASVPRAQYFEVAFADQHFVIAGVGAALTSSDGDTWEEMRCAEDSMCGLTKTPPTPSCIGDACTADPAPAIDYLALQRVTAVGDKFYAHGGSGALASTDAQTFSRVANVPDAAMGGVLLSMSGDAETHWVRQVDIEKPATSVFASEDDGQTWIELPLELADSVDCRQMPCVAVPQGILAFVSTP